MKYLIILFFILLPSILNQRIVIDLDQGNNTKISEALEQLNWINDSDFKDYDTKADEYKVESFSNTDVKLFSNTQGEINLSTKFPSIKVSDALKEDPFIKYSVALQPSEDCLIQNYPEKSNGLDIQCTYTCGHYSSATKTITKKFKKEISFGRFLLGLREDGLLEVGVVVGNEIKYGRDSEEDWFNEAFSKFKDLKVKDIFLHYDFDGYLLIFSEEFLFIYTYESPDSFIKFNMEEKINLNPLNLELTGLRAVSYYKQGGVCLLILKDGFYKLLKTSGRWQHELVSSIENEGSKIELKGFEIIVQLDRIGIIIKGYGLIYCIINDLGGISPALQIFKHNYLIGFLPVLQKNEFKLGVLVDNQVDKNEVYIEFEYADWNDELLLRRALTSSKKVKATHTDFRGSMNMLLVGEDIFLIPNNYQTRSLPIYVVKSTDGIQNFEFLHVNRKTNMIMFKQTKKNGDLDELVVLYNKPEDREAFTCKFTNEGNYLVELRKEEFDLDRKTKNVLRLSQYNVIIAKNEEKKDDKEDKDNKKDSNGKQESLSNNIVFIIVIAILALIIICLTAALLCSRFRRKRDTNVALLNPGNYNIST
jgi:hypothetical protein